MQRNGTSKQLERTAADEKTQLQNELIHVQAELKRTTTHLMKVKQELEEKNKSKRHSNSEHDTDEARGPVIIQSPQNIAVVDTTPLTNQLNAAETAKMELEHKVRRLQDLLDEERLANEQLMAQLREKQERERNFKQEEQETTLADELGSAFQSSSLSSLPQSMPDIEELRQYIASLHAEKECILADFRQREQEKQTEQQEAERHRQELEEKFRITQADLEQERARRLEAEIAAKTAWERSQKLLRETEAAEEMKQHLAKLEEHQQQQRSLISDLEVINHACSCYLSQ